MNKLVSYEVSFLGMNYNTEQVIIDLCSTLGDAQLSINCPFLDKFDDYVSILKLFLPNKNEAIEDQGWQFSVRALNLNFSIDENSECFDSFLRIL